MIRKIIAIGVAAFWCISAATASTYQVQFLEVGGNVEATGSGSIDLTGSDFLGTATISLSRVWPSDGFLFFDNGTYDVYQVSIADQSFGPGSIFTADSSSGDNVGFWAADDFFYTPLGYISGDPLSAEATWQGESFLSLGMNTGIYDYQAGATTFRVIVGEVSGQVPLPAAFPLLLIGLGVLRATGGRRKAKHTG